MSLFKPYKIDSSKLSTLPVRDGQFIICSDSKKIYVDSGSERIDLTAAGITYELSKSGNTISLIGNDGSKTSVTDSDTNTTYSLSSFGITATAAELNKLDGCTATVTELNYVDGVTSNIQTQLNNKASSSHTHSGYASSSHNHSASNITSGTFSSSRLPTIPLTKGGTGATTAATARNALDVPSLVKLYDNSTGATSVTISGGSSYTWFLISVANTSGDTYTGLARYNANSSFVCHVNGATSYLHFVTISVSSTKASIAGNLRIPLAAYQFGTGAGASNYKIKKVYGIVPPT